MKIAWTKHLADPKEKQDFENSIRASKHILRRIGEICDEMERGLDVSETSKHQYENPNWQYLQADNNGYRRCLKELRELMDIDSNIYK